MIFDDELGDEDLTESLPTQAPAAEPTIATSRSAQIIRRQRIIIGIAAVCALLAAGGLVASRFIKSPTQAAAEAGAPKASLISAPVSRRVLASTLIYRGTVGTGSQLQITPLATGSDSTASVITAVRTHTGDTVQPGHVLLEVSGRPLIVLAGKVPAYRDLKPGDHGDDVGELQTALAGLGDFNGSPTGTFGSATKHAITELYTHLGYDVPTTGGPDDSGDRDALQSAHQSVADAQRSVDDMNRQITAANANAAQTPPASTKTTSGKTTSGTGATKSEPTPVSGDEPLSVQLQYLQNALNLAINNEQYLIAHTGPMMPASEVAFVPKFPARVTTLNGHVGSTVQPPLVTIATGALVVTDQMDPSQAQLLKTGMTAQLDSEVLGSTAVGTVSNIGPITADTPTTATTGPTANGGDGGQTAAGAPYVPVTITPTKALPAAWNGQDVRVTVTSAKTRSAVLAVPIGAITTRADGQTIVSKVLSSSGTTTPIVVTTGVSADGYVQITPQAAASLTTNDAVSLGR